MKIYMVQLLQLMGWLIRKKLAQSHRTARGGVSEGFLSVASFSSRSQVTKLSPLELNFDLDFSLLTHKRTVLGAASAQWPPNQLLQHPESESRGGRPQDSVFNKHLLSCYMDSVEHLFLPSVNSHAFFPVNLVHTGLFLAVFLDEMLSLAVIFRSLCLCCLKCQAHPQLLKQSLVTNAYLAI